MKKEEKIELAESLMNAFADRTGLNGNGNDRRRYLWTDAFAFRAFLGLFHVNGQKKYREIAFNLIDRVHHVLGRFREDDPREGWISGLPEEEGKTHPTAGGLRIGKDLPERKVGESYNARLEWGRDGQYYHYLTKWMGTLMLAYEETKEDKFANWAAELAITSDNFIEKRKGRLRMYWKMSTDLSRPLVDNMGAQDALEGAILVRRAKELVPTYSDQLEMLIADLDQLCIQNNWSTTDPLGLGGLLLNALNVLQLDEIEVSREIRTDKLLEDSVQGLERYTNQNSLVHPAYERLPFRECGLSLGLRVIQGLPSDLERYGHKIQPYFSLAEEIEQFWSQTNHQKVHTWKDHLDINAVSLACSLIADSFSKTFRF